MPESENTILEDSPNRSDAAEIGSHDQSRRVRVPHFPTYGQVRQLLKVWPGYRKADVTGLHTALAQLRGNPQNPVDWTDPDTWIPERLSGPTRDLAMAIWNESGHGVNPRYTSGHWLLVQKYEFLREASGGVLELTDIGRNFRENQGGKAEKILDEQEGVVELLRVVSDSGPIRKGELIEAWSNYLEKHSRFRTNSTIRDTLRRRLNNLLNRELIVRERFKYSATSAGIEYLERVAPLPGPTEQIRKLTNDLKAAVRTSLRETLLQMEPSAFEQLVGRLLDAMNYQNVKVVGKSGDGGVDVLAEIELGVTSVCEVVQAKRHKRTVQRKALDALRGSLYRFNAQRGTIVTTSRFAKGAVEAAFAQRAAPITLIDGDKLIDMLIEHDIGVRKETIEVLSIDQADLSSVEDLDEE